MSEHRPPLTINPGCNGCPAAASAELCSLAGRLERVYVSEAFAEWPLGDMASAEDAIRQREITPDAITSLGPQIETDINLSLTSCFAILHDKARQDQETLATLVDEQRIAVAGCATRQLRRTCQNL